MADTKNVYEQLEELKEKINEANKPRTLTEQLANDDPAAIEFVKNAKRVWRYHGEHSDFDRKIKALQKRGLILILWKPCRLTSTPTTKCRIIRSR